MLRLNYLIIIISLFLQADNELNVGIYQDRYIIHVNSFGSQDTNEHTPSTFRSEPTFGHGFDTIVFPPNLTTIEIVMVTDFENSNLTRVLRDNLIKYINYYNKLTIGNMPLLKFRKIIHMKSNVRNYDRLFKKYYNSILVEISRYGDNILNQRSAAGTGSPYQIEIRNLVNGIINYRNYWAGGSITLRSSNVAEYHGEIQLEKTHVFLHELGHALGLCHGIAEEDIMSYSTRLSELESLLTIKNYQYIISSMFKSCYDGDGLFSTKYAYFYPLNNSVIALYDNNYTSNGNYAAFFTSLKGFNKDYGLGKNRPLNLKIYVMINGFYKLAVNISGFQELGSKLYGTTETCQKTSIDIGGDARDILRKIYDENKDTNGLGVYTQYLRCKVVATGYLSPYDKKSRTITRKYFITSSRSK